jgi:MOSC domain-containing protein YiiM
VKNGQFDRNRQKKCIARSNGETRAGVNFCRSALARLGGIDLDWSARRANLLVSGIKLPRGRGSQIAIGDVVVEVRDQTSPCQQMENAQVGLRKALSGDWRGGVSCRVISGGEIRIGDGVQTILEVPETIIRLP